MLFMHNIYTQFLRRYYLRHTPFKADTTKFSRHLTMAQPKEREEQQTHVLQTHQQ